MKTRRSSTARKASTRHGGSRPGAGRPPKPAPLPKPPRPPRPIAGTAIDGRKVARLARLGAGKESILTALRIPRGYLQRAEFVTGFDEEIAFGVARREIDLLRERRDLARGRAGNGKVSATLAGLRNLGPNWDRVDKDRGERPADQQGAIAELDRLLSKLGRKT